ncbi:hypothetical protein ONZ51_g11428 [Trametes cubensis]|uniref:F-box domain-containing protein n=1 Tax=Trametes cubensis TaxID=1111947 RepID=A0AAD7THL8_9APHY|nr:hypothetical protein ONZ51_g11428 [Trametes cubensis]
MSNVPDSPTRSRHHASLASSALALPTRRDIRITTLENLQHFVVLGNYNTNIGRVVEDLSIALPSNVGYPAQALRAALRLAPNIECLVLDVPAESPISLLSSLQFPNLRVFSTNLPHRALVAFLNSHPHLDALALRDCGRSAACPLRGVEFSNLTNLQCPSRCFVGILRGPLIAATVNLSRMTSMSSIALRSLSSSHLHSLTVDYFNNDYDVILHVINATPNLRKLKLNEKAQPQRRHDGSTRRPWNDLQEWHRSLLRLPFLEEFMLRTLISVCTGNRTELDVVTAWARGTGRRATPHSNLYHIALMQRHLGGAPGLQQQLSHWFKHERGVWARVTTVAVGPSDSFTM